MNTIFTAINFSMIGGHAGCYPGKLKFEHIFVRANNYLFCSISKNSAET